MDRRHMRQLAIVTLLSLFGAGVAGCAGGGSKGALPALATHTGVPNASGALATLRITIPKKSGARPQYVSPATTQMAINIQQGGSSITGYPQTVGLTPTSTGCSSTLTSTLCQLSIALAPGSYTTTLTLEDASANVLSSAQTIPFTVVAGTNNTINLTLSGVPHSIAVTGSYAIRGSAGTGFTFYGAAPQKIFATAVDADGNYIIGPGSPTFSASVVSGSGYSATAPAATTPNAIPITPPGTNGSTAILAVTAAYSDATCSQAGAVCTTTFAVKNDIQTLYVLNAGGPDVTGYKLPVTTGVSPSIAAFNGGKFAYGWTLGLNPSGDVFVADPSVGGHPAGTSAVYEYSPAGSFITSIPSTSGLNKPWSLAFDANGTLYVGDLAASDVAIFPSPYTTTTPVLLTRSTSGSAIVDVEQVLFDGSGNLWVGTYGPVYEYKPPFAAANNANLYAPTVNAAGPESLVFDPLNNLYAAFASNTTVVRKLLAPGYFSSSDIFSAGSPGTYPNALATDAAGDVFMAACNYCGGVGGADYINEYSASGTLLASFTTGVSFPQNLAIDGAGNLYVANCPTCVLSTGTGSITVYSPPFTNASVPVATLNDATIAGPDSMAITP
ncbi:MAG TPA: hypothetical protein VMW12_03935 [Candidatus Dormibacteraeota bacterium]|nr:hypothetical protein [Candidatus Dormibacteraeota bacterium]